MVLLRPEEQQRPNTAPTGEAKKLWSSGGLRDRQIAGWTGQPAVLNLGLDDSVEIQRPRRRLVKSAAQGRGPEGVKGALRPGADSADRVRGNTSPTSADRFGRKSESKTDLGAGVPGPGFYHREPVFGANSRSVLFSMLSREATGEGRPQTAEARVGSGQRKKDGRCRGSISRSIMALKGTDGVFEAVGADGPRGDLVGADGLRVQPQLSGIGGAVGTDGFRGDSFREGWFPEAEAAFSHHEEAEAVRFAKTSTTTRPKPPRDWIYRPVRLIPKHRPAPSESPQNASHYSTAPSRPSFPSGADPSQSLKASPGGNWDEGPGRPGVTVPTDANYEPAVTQPRDDSTFGAPSPDAAALLSHSVGSRHIGSPGRGGGDGGEYVVLSVAPQDYQMSLGKPVGVGALYRELTQTGFTNGAESTEDLERVILSRLAQQSRTERRKDRHVGNLELAILALDVERQGSESIEA